MKKLICILLAVTFCLTLLAGCGGAAEKPAAEPAAPAAEEPAAEEPAAEEPAAEEPAEPQRVLAMWMALGDSNWTMLNNILEGYFVEGGYEYEALSAENDPLKQLEQLENAVIVGYDLIFIMPISGEAVADGVKAAVDAGIPVYAFIQDPLGNASVLRSADQDLAGRKLAQTAAEWALEKFPDAGEGEINTVVVGHDFSTEQKIYWEALNEELAKYPELNIMHSSTIESSIDAGQTVTENILTKFPNEKINLWVCSSSAGVLGMNSALMSPNSGVDYYDEMGIVCNVINAEVAGLMRLSLTNEALIRRCASMGGRIETNLLEVYQDCDKLLHGEELPSFSPVNVDTVTPENLADFGY